MVIPVKVQCLALSNTERSFSVRKQFRFSVGKSNNPYLWHTRLHDFVRPWIFENITHMGVLLIRHSWTHLLIDGWECGSRSQHPVFRALRHASFRSYTQVSMIHTHFPVSGLMLFIQHMGDMDQVLHMFKYSIVWFGYTCGDILQ